MAAKRSHIELDPDYEDVSEEQNKRRRVLEEGAKEATKRKIEAIIRKQFEIEIENKEAEILNISEKLEVSRNVMDRLRACIVASYYGNASQKKAPTNKMQEQAPMIHPSVRKYIGKAPPGTPLPSCSGDVKQEAPEEKSSGQRTIELESERIGNLEPQVSEKAQADVVAPHTDTDHTETRTGRFRVKKRVIVGNLSKSIPADQRDENDQATHKWMVYVRGPKEHPRIDEFVKKVWFFLHPSYRPNDLVEVSHPPFHLTRRGWGEFPVRVQLHFKDARNKRLDIVHSLKLDRTYTGLQTLGAETVVDIEVERDRADIKRENRDKDVPLSAHTSRYHDSSCSVEGSTSVEVKQEPGVVNSVDTSPNISVSPILRQIKTEPVDHDYEVAASVGMASTPTSSAFSNLHNVKIKTEPGIGGTNLHNVSLQGTSSATVTSQLQSIVSTSIITTQAQTPLLFRVEPVTPTKKNLVRVEQGTPNSVKISGIQPSPKNVVLQSFGSVSSATLSDSKTLAQKQSNTVITPSINLAQPLLQTRLAGNQLLVQTALETTKAQSVLQNKSPGNQSPASGLVFLKCTDNQGKTYLIPHQICTSVSPSKGNNPVNLVRVASPNTQPVLLTSTPSRNQTNIRIPFTLNSSLISQSPHTLLPTNMNKALNVGINLKLPLQKEPTLFIKPDCNVGKTSQNMVQTKSVPVSLNNLVKVTSATGLQLLRNTTPSQFNTNSPSVKNVNQSANNIKNVNQSATNVKSANQSANNMKNLTTNASNVKILNPATNVDNLPVGKGQLKVTSQGLIHIERSPSRNVVLNKSDLSSGNIIMNGGISPTSPPIKQKQPVVLVPNNNKLTLVTGKGTSLLNHPVLQSISVPQSNGNIMLNQSNSLLGKVGVTSSTMSVNQNKIASGQTCKTKQSRSIVNAPNHLVIIPVTSEQSVAMTTSSQSGCQATVVVSSQSAKNRSVEKKAGDKSTMFIVMQNDKTKGITLSTANSKSEGQRSGLSLLGSRSLNSTQSPSVSLSTDFCETTVTVSSGGSKEKQIIVVNKGDRILESSRALWGREKKLIDLKKKRVKLPETTETVSPLRLGDYPDMVSLVRASVLRHPVVSATAGRQLHPYCSRSMDEWLSWNVGKRRSSEWQRASSIRKFIMSYLDGGITYKGESLWTTKQILAWCRLHAYSPHYLEKPLHPTAIDLQAETSLPSGKHHVKFTSVSSSDPVVQEVTSLKQLMTSSDCSSDDEIDIVHVGPSRVKMKTEIKEEVIADAVEFLPITEGAVFVEDTAKKIGVKLEPTEVEPGCYGTLTHGIVYKAMESFMGDLLRETFSLQVNMGRYPDALGVADVYSALTSLPITDFLTNKYLGVEETESIPNTNR